MDKKRAQEYLIAQLKAEDNLVGFFQAVKPVSFIWILFIGPLALLGMKYYIVAVSEQGVFFHRLNVWGKFAGYDFFHFDDIESVSVKDGFLQKPMYYFFKNGRKLKIKAQLKGSSKIAKLDEATLSYLQERVAA
jgi:hypothetical protein